ncbi:CASP-like protein 1E2 [Cinnamomum micranthum f. kanehirae]|uniref:CASP-like protein n=1 Tax=Cinnamomum micranthum f. kanehirae TaxID=337451 RepID=A0A443PTJ6_9MAGN|nr:CASP-like protein 1E2 [Cinnamomum micranthum f. kanehirae]
MESQVKSNIDGTQMEESRSNQVHVANPKNIRSSDFLLRLLVIGTTLAAAIVMGLAKETEVVPVSIFPGIPPVSVKVHAKMRYSSALVYFVVANAIACGYALLSLFATIGQLGGPKGVGLGITILDVIMVALLFSGEGAAATIGVLGHEGNWHLRWNKVCNRFEKFCRSLAVSLILSMMGSLVFLLLVVLSIMHLHRRSR